MDEKYYSVDETAEKLEVHAKTIRRYIYNGKIQALKVGGQWRIYQTALDEYYERSKHTGSNETVSQDDFCIFMDGQKRISDDKIQVCSIVDYYIETQEKAKPLVHEITNVMLSMDGQGKYRFNYVYDVAENRVRFVLWGDAVFMEEVAKRIRDFEQS